MRVVAVHHVADTDRTVPEGWEVWETRLGAGETYGMIARHAADHEWGTDVIVVQDDVRFRIPPEPVSGELVVYGEETRPDHYCPRAFAATPKVWSRLAHLWSGGQVCRRWYKVVRQHGVVLNVTEHLEPAGSRGGGSR